MNDNCETGAGGCRDLMTTRVRVLWWVALAIIIVTALMTRLIDLAAKPLHHDESLFAYYGYMLSIGSGYIYQPILHGAVLQNVSAFFFAVLGADKFTMRLPVVLGALAMFPLIWCWRRYLGRWGTLAAMAAVVLSPSICFYSRFLRNDVPFMVVTCWCALCVLRAMQTGLPRYWFWGIAAAVLSFSMMESSIFFFACCFAYLAVMTVADTLAGRRMPLTQERVSPSGERIVPQSEDVKPKAFAEICRGIFAEAVCVGPLVGGILVLLGWRLWPRMMDGFAGACMHAVPAWPVWLTPLTVWVGAGLVCGGVWYRLRVQSVRPIGKMAVAGVFARNAGRNWWVIVSALFLGVAFYQTVFTTWFTNVRGTDFDGNPVILTALQIYKNTWDYWWDQHLLHRIKGPFHYHLPILFMYELPVLLFIIWSWWRGLIRSHNGLRHALWLVVPQVTFSVLGTFAQKAGLIDWAFMDKWLHVTSLTHLHLILFYVQVLLYFSPMLFLKRRFVESFLIFWFITELFAYSFAGEKVPWLAVHITAPACILFGYYVQQSVRRLCCDGWSIWRRRAVGVAIVLAIFCQARALWFVCFVHPYSPVERLVYNHTHPDVEIAVADMQKLSHDTLLGNRFPYLMQGEVAWPLFWYFRDMQNPVLLPGETIDNTRRPVVIADWFDAISSDNLSRNYTLKRLKVREWWEPPMLNFGRLAGAWRFLVPQSRLDTPGAMAVAASSTEWRKLWNYLIWREIWLDTRDREYSNSANEFAFCVRRDLYDGYLSPSALSKRGVRRELAVYPPRWESPVTDEMLELWTPAAPVDADNREDVTTGSAVSEEPVSDVEEPELQETTGKDSAEDSKTSVSENNL